MVCYNASSHSSHQVLKQFRIFTTDKVDTNGSFNSYFQSYAVSAKRAFNQKQIFETSLRDVLIEKVFAVKSIFRKATFTDISFVLENNFMVFTAFQNYPMY